MAGKECCHTCKQKGDCRQVYRQLGDVEGPSVAAKVLLAFLLPLVVFIVALAVFERMLAGVIANSRVLAAVSLLPALWATFACIVITRDKVCKNEG